MCGQCVRRICCAPTRKTATSGAPRRRKSTATPLPTKCRTASSASKAENPKTPPKHGPDKLKDLLYRLADDQLILGHRNSEWNGLGPILEEDIAFSSMAQDKLGHSLQLYTLLHQLGEAEPDTVAFTRNAPQFHCCQLVELPIGEYDFSLIRHFLFDHAELLRFEALATAATSRWPR
jgi:1,2-phenylacetyl-CoA epoxidase catalytic subunit